MSVHLSFGLCEVADVSTASPLSNAPLRLGDPPAAGSDFFDLSALT
jgi:hypothetical protein